MILYIDDVDKTLEFQEPDFQTQSPFLSVLKENDTDIQIAFPQIGKVTCCLIDWLADWFNT